MSLRRVISVNPGGLEHGGGIGRMVGYMVEAFQDRPGAPRFTVLDSRGPGRLDLAPFYFAACLLRILASRVRGRALLHVHLAGRGSTLRKVVLVHLAAALRLPVVLHLHDYDYGAFLAGLPRATLGPIGSMFRRAKVVVTLGSRDRELVVRRFRLSPKRVLTAPNAVPRPVRVRKASAGPARVLFLGDPSRRKGVHDLLAALKRLAEAPGVAPWTAVIAGGGRELDGFRRDVRDLGLTARVETPGWVDRDAAGRLLAGADILVLPSYAEGQAMSVLEAMAHGLCVVCTPVGALAETVQDGVSAMLVAPGDVSALTAALYAGLSDPDLRSRLGAGARARFEAEYDGARYPARIQAAYDLACA